MKSAKDISQETVTSVSAAVGSTGTLSANRQRTGESSARPENDNDNTNAKLQIDWQKWIFKSSLLQNNGQQKVLINLDKFSVNNQALQPTSCTQTHVIGLVQLSQHRKEALNNEWRNSLFNVTGRPIG